MPRKKECPSCAMEVDASEKDCPICGYEFAETPAKWRWTAAILAAVILMWLLWRSASFFS